MLKPFVCLACEKVTTTKEGLASLINLFAKLTITLPEGQTIAPNAVAPKEWAVFSVWKHEPGDENREYILCTQMCYPDQSPFGQTSRLKINVEADKQNSQVAVTFVGFPIGQTGSYTVRSWVEENQQMVVGPIEVDIQVEIRFQTQLAAH